MATIKIIFLLPVLGYRLLVTLLSSVSYYYYQRRRWSNSRVASRLHHRYVFLFPVFREQKVIEETFYYYQRFLGWFPDLKILFVTTEKEQDDPSTRDILKKLIVESACRNRIDCISCPDLHGTKATQVNFGLNYIRSQHKKTPYIVSFDCDARIRWQDFLLADQYIQRSPTHMVYSFLPRPRLESTTNLLARSIVLHYGERMLAFEYPSGLDPGLNYPMGATIIFSPKLWGHIEHIPEPIDDLSLKYILDYHQLSYVSLPYFTDVQSPPDISNLYRQMVPIFSGVFSHFSTLRSYGIPLKMKNIWVGWGFYLFCLLEYLSILLLLPAVVTGEWLLPILFLYQIILDLFFLGKLSLGNFFMHLLGYAIRLSQFIYFLGWRLFWGDKLCQFKTERGVPKRKKSVLQ